MLENIDFSKLAVLIDFDGTLTTKDTNIELMDKYGDNLEDIKNKYREGELTFTEYFKAEVDKVRVSKEEYIQFILNNIELSPGFMEFYDFVKSEGIKIGIVSGGFEEAIFPFLNKHGIEDVEVLANQLEFHGDQPNIIFRDGMYDDCCDLGPCGNCKVRHYQKYKEDYSTVIFIGDGTTDMPVARISDITFAKDSLASYLDKENIDYISYEDFRNINKKLFGQ